jgi:hypothetical protein
MIGGAVPAIAAGLGLCASGLIVEAAERSS